MFISVGCVRSLKANSTVSLLKGAGHCCWVEAKLGHYVKKCQDFFLFTIKPPKNGATNCLFTP